MLRLLRNSAMLIFLSLVGLKSLGQEDSIVLTGTYQGVPLYVQNPFSEDGIGYCVYDVSINNQKVMMETSASAFEIKLNDSFFEFGIGDSLRITLFKKGDCYPKILNNQVIFPRPKLNILESKIDENNNLIWTAINEKSNYPFVIQQYRWNKWIKIGEVDSRGLNDTLSYQFNVSGWMTVGENKFRICKEDWKSTLLTGVPITIESTLSPIKIEFSKKECLIIFDRMTYYEVYDHDGNITKKGFGETVNMDNLKSGNYYLNYDNQNISILKNKKGKLKLAPVVKHKSRYEDPY